MKNNKKRKLNEVSGDPPPERQAVTKRRKVDKYALMEFFEKKIEEKALLKRHLKANEKAKPSAFKFQFNNQVKSDRINSTLGLKVIKRFSVEMQALVIFLRYGSLNSDKNIWMKTTDIY
jgi:hypothetical protein